MSAPRSRPDDATTSIRALLRPRPRMGAMLDSRASIELVGRATASAQVVPHGADPVAAARRWVGRTALPAEIVQRAGAALDVADAYWSEVDVLASQLAQECAARGDASPDPTRLAQIDAMTATIARFATELRTVLDDAGSDPARTARRLDVALDAARSNDAGLPALAVALSARA